MANKQKLVQQLILLQKAADIAESLRRLYPPSWTMSLGEKGKGFEVKARSLSWRDLRICSYDVRPFFVKSDPLHYSRLSHLAKPFAHHENEELFSYGLERLLKMPLLEGRHEPLEAPHIPFEVPSKKQHAPNELVVFEDKGGPGYYHTPWNVATAYLYGRWAHSTRWEEYHVMAEKLGKEADYLALTWFAFNAGQSILTSRIGKGVRQSGSRNRRPGNRCNQLLAPSNWSTDFLMALRYQRDQSTSG
jgi:hypothetical protein